MFRSGKLEDTKIGKEDRDSYTAHKWRRECIDSNYLGRPHIENLINHNLDHKFGRFEKDKSYNELPGKLGESLNI